MKMEEVFPLSEGDLCLDCQRQGLDKRLRNFYINLDEETLLKCESDTCMYPYNNEIDDDEEDDDVNIFSSAIEDNNGNIMQMPDFDITLFQDTPSSSSYIAITQSYTETKMAADEESLTTDCSNVNNCKQIINLKQETDEITNNVIPFKFSVKQPKVTKKKEIQLDKTLPTANSIGKQDNAKQNNTLTHSMPKASLFTGRQFLKDFDACVQKQPMLSHKCRNSRKDKAAIPGPSASSSSGANAGVPKEQKKLLKLLTILDKKKAASNIEDD